MLPIYYLLKRQNYPTQTQMRSNEIAVNFHQRIFECCHLLVGIVAPVYIESKRPIMVIGSRQGMYAGISAVGGIGRASYTSHSPVTNAEHHAPDAGMHEGHGLVDIGLLRDVDIVPFSEYRIDPEWRKTSLGKMVET